MNLADIVGGQVVIHPDMLAIPPFKKLWDSFKDKDLATKYLWYIVLKNKYDSPYVETMERDLIEPTLKKELFGNENYELPEIVTQAEDSWKSRTYSLLEYMLDGLLLKLEGAAKYYHLSKDDEMDLDSIIRLHPEIVIVDELAHTNVEGSLNEKRWQDVMTLLDEGINVISAINIQHIESVNEEVQEITGIEVKERVPDSVLQEADEVVNIDLTAEELIARLKAGKIYRPEKIQTALDNFFRTENILQLRELALKEVALRVEKKVENEVVMGVAVGLRHEKFMACISSHEKTPRRIIRKAAKLATRYNTTFIALYVQTPKESMDRIDLASQRYLLNHFKLVAELGGEVVQVQSKDILGSIVKVCKEKQISTVCMGTPNLRLPYAICSILGYRKFLNNLSQANVDLIILA